MLPVTIGKNFFPGIKIPLLIIDNEINSHINMIDESFKIIFAYNGSGIIDIENKSYPFISPSIFCFDDRTKINIIKQNDFHYLAIFFHLAIINDSLTSDHIYNNKIEVSGTNMDDLWLLKQLFQNNDKFHINIGPATSERIIMLFKQVKRQMNEQDDAFWPCRGRSYFIELLILIERITYQTNSSFDETIPSNELEEIYPVILYMNNSYQEKISINGLARLFNTNRTSLTDKFIKATGIPPIKYLIKLRIKIASQLLQDTSIPVNEIIERVGFDDLTHFGRMFKKYTGVSPSVYRDKFTIPKYILA